MRHPTLRLRCRYRMLLTTPRNRYMRFDPRFSVLEAFAEVFVQAAQPRPAPATVDTVKCSGLGWIDELAAGLSHGRSVGAQALRENRIGRNLGSDLSEGGCSVFTSHLADYKLVK